MTTEQKLIARSMWRGFDFQKALSDENYALRHFLNFYLISNGVENFSKSKKDITKLLESEIKNINAKTKFDTLKSNTFAVARKIGLGKLKRLIFNKFSL